MHGEAATQAAIDASGALFGRGGNLEDIDEETLESVLDGFKVVGEERRARLPRLQARRSRNRRRPGCRTVQVRFRGTPRHQVRWRVSQQQPYRDEEQVLAEADFLAGRFALIRRGKKRSAP